MAGEKDAIVRMLFRQEGMQDVGKEASKVKEEIKGIGDAASGMASNLDAAAASSDAITQAEQKVAESAKEAAGALQDLGTAGTSVGEQIAAGLGPAEGALADLTRAAASGAGATDEAIAQAVSAAGGRLAAVQQIIQATRFGAESGSLDEQLEQLQEYEAALVEVTNAYQNGDRAADQHAAEAFESLSAIRTAVYEVIAALQNEAAAAGEAGAVVSGAAGQSAEAVTGVATAADAAAAAITASSATAADSVADIGAAASTAADATAAASTEVAATVAQATTAFLAQIDQIRSGGSSLQAQLEALEEQERQIVEVQQSLTTVEVSSGSAQFQAVTAALEEVRNHIAEVNGLLREQESQIEDLGSAAAETFRRQADAIEESSAPLEVKKRLLTQIEEQLSAELQAHIDSGNVATASAADTANALAQVRAAISRVNDGLKQEQKAYTDAGAAAKDSADKSVAAMLQQADAVQSTTSNLEAQKVGLSDVASQLRDVLKEALAAGDAQKDKAIEAANAYADVKGRLDSVTEAIKAQKQAQDAQVPSITAISTATLSMQDAAVNAVTAINTAWEQYNESSRITPANITKSAEAIEAFKLSIIDTRGTMEAATTEEIALLQRLEAELQKVSDRSNALTNAGKDQRVVLQETGQRLAGMGAAAQAVGKYFGEAGAQVGSFMAQAGGAAQVIDQLKDSVQGLNINQIGAAKGAIGLTAQIAALVATAAVAATSGLKLAAVNKENAEGMRDAKKAAEELGISQSGLKDGWDGFQVAVQEVLSSLDQFAPVLGSALAAFKPLDSFRDISRFFADFTENINNSERSSKLLGDLSRSMDQYSVALRSGRTGVDLYRVAIDAGLSSSEAFKLGLIDAAEVQVFYNDAVSAGVPGQKLWAQAVANSSGSASGLIREVRLLMPTMTDLIGQQGRLPALLQKEYEERRKVNEKIKEANDAYRQLAGAMDNEVRERDEAARHTLEYNTVTNGTTRAINEQAAAIAQHVGQSQNWSVELARNADEMQRLLDKQGGLTVRERERIQTLIDLASRGGELTRSEQAYAKALAQTLVANEAVSASFRNRITAMAAVDTAMASLIELTKAEATANLSVAETYELRAKAQSAGVSAAAAAQATAIAQAAAAARAALAANTDLDAVDRMRLETIVELAGQINSLSLEQEALSASTKQATDQSEAAADATAKQADSVRDLLDANADAAAAQSGLFLSMEEFQAKQNEWWESGKRRGVEQLEQTTQITIAQSARNFEIQQEINEKARLIDVLAKEKTAADEVAVSQNELVKIVRDGQVVWTNLTEEQRKANEQLGQTSVAAREAGEAIGGILIRRMEDGSTVITNTAASVGEQNQKWDELIAVTGRAIGPLDDINTRYSVMADTLERITLKLNDLPALFDAVGAAAARAAGEGDALELGDAPI